MRFEKFIVNFGSYKVVVSNDFLNFYFLSMHAIKMDLKSLFFSFNRIDLFSQLLALHYLPENWKIQTFLLTFITNISLWRKRVILATKVMAAHFIAKNVNNAHFKSLSSPRRFIWINRNLVSNSLAIQSKWVVNVILEKSLKCDLSIPSMSNVHLLNHHHRHYNCNSCINDDLWTWITINSPTFIFMKKFVCVFFSFGHIFHHSNRADKTRWNSGECIGESSHLPIFCHV